MPARWDGEDSFPFFRFQLFYVPRPIIPVFRLHSIPIGKLRDAVQAVILIAHFHPLFGMYAVHPAQKVIFIAGGNACRVGHAPDTPRRVILIGKGEKHQF